MFNVKSEAVENVISKLKLELEKMRAATAATPIKTRDDVWKNDLELAEADETCRFWINNGRWPETKHYEDIALQFLDRFSNARSFARPYIEHQLRFRPDRFTDGKITEKDLMEFLLIADWRGCVSNIKMVIRHMKTQGQFIPPDVSTTSPFNSQ